MRRLTTKLAKSRLALASKEFKAKDNTFDKDKAAAEAGRAMALTASERHYLRLETRAAHLVQMMFKNIAYRSAEQNTKKQTMPAKELLFKYFPRVVSSLT